MNTKKIVSFFVTAVIAASSLFALAACDNTPKRELEGIEVTTAPTKIKYVEGEKFDTASMVVSKVYSDESKEALAATDYTYSPSGNLKLTDKKVTITYKADEKSYTASVNIKVTNEVESVEIVTQPNKTSYIAGELFNPAGMTIKAVLENGDEEDVIEVTDQLVTYKTVGLVKSDEHFEMSYGGCTFYLDISVSHGAFVEAEAGQIATSGAKIADSAPDTSAIEKDYENALGNRDDAQGHRGIDEGKNCLQTGITSCYKGENGCTITGGRVDMRTYFYNHLEWTETTGGTPAKSGLMQKNHISFSKGGKMLYRLTADKAGKVTVTFKIANPHFAGDSSPENSLAVETKLNEVIKLSVANADVAIPDSALLESVDWREYKSYNTAADYANKGNSDLYTGKLCKPTFCWQNVSVDINVQQGINDLAVESIWDGDVKLDSISCNADEDEITISMNSEFKPIVKSAQIKVADDKVLMGVIVDAQAVNYTDDEVKDFLALTRIPSIRNTAHSGNVGDSEENDPWTQSVGNGGLGYTDGSPSYKSGMSYSVGTAVEVEKITDGAFKDMFIVWFDVTIREDGATPAQNRYLGVWAFSSFDYGTAYAESKPSGDVRKTDENVTAELGGYCYQVYSDTRDQNITFGWGSLCLAVQAGTFDETLSSESNPLRQKLMRRYIPWFADNDEEFGNKDVA